jgi:hypothetical protein
MDIHVPSPPSQLLEVEPIVASEPDFDRYAFMKEGSQPWWR